MQGHILGQGRALPGTPTVQEKGLSHNILCGVGTEWTKMGPESQGYLDTSFKKPFLLIPPNVVTLFTAGPQHLYSSTPYQNIIFTLQIYVYYGSSIPP